MPTAKRPFRLGVLVNPYAGIGGALALKGSDGALIRQQALAAGAVQLANEKMQRAIREFYQSPVAIDYITASADMGESCLRALGITPEVIYCQEQQESQASDTEKALDNMLNANIDFLLFAGGDGTARNVANVIGQKCPVLGVPAGCKIHSGVYAVTPSAAGKVALKVISGELVSQSLGEVRDIDEQAFRQSKVISKYYGDMRVPQDLSYVQSVKMGGQESDELVLQDIIDYVSDMLADDEQHYYVMGSGSTVNALMQQLDLSNTLLGVDIVHQGELVASDVNAAVLQDLIVTHGEKVRVIVTIIGGQGHVFGRGNQQFSPAFLAQLNKQNLFILASKLKLASLQGRPMRIDSGDEAVDKQFYGPTTVISGYNDQVLYPLE